MATDARARFLEKLAASLADDSFVRLRLTSPAKGGALPKQVEARLVELRGGRHLSFTLRHATRDETKNLAPDAAQVWIAELLGGQFSGAYLGTAGGDWQLRDAGRPNARLVRHAAAATIPPARAHDRAGPALLDATAQDWLCGLGITTAQGAVASGMADKHRQISHYLEILSHLIADCGWPGARTAPLVIADMGCGKGYLTFGAWHLLCRSGKLPARVLGVEQRPELVETCNQLARRIGAADLEFIPGTIASAALPERLDALIALHACDTATDDALRRGIAAGAQLIVVAPCCQKELRPQLGRPAPLDAVLRHGLMAGRMADWLTDGLRALFLEWAGYETKVIEFVASSHTPKNLMISAVRRAAPFTDAAARERIIALKTFFGIRRHALDGLLEHGLGQS